MSFPINSVVNWVTTLNTGNFCFDLCDNFDELTEVTRSNELLKNTAKADTTAANVSGNTPPHPPKKLTISGIDFNITDKTNSPQTLDISVSPTFGASVNDKNIGTPMEPRRNSRKNTIKLDNVNLVNGNNSYNSKQVTLVSDPDHSSNYLELVFDPQTTQKFVKGYKLNADKKSDVQNFTVDVNGDGVDDSVKLKWVSSNSQGNATTGDATNPKTPDSSIKLKSYQRVNHTEFSENSYNEDGIKTRQGPPRSVREIQDQITVVRITAKPSDEVQ